MDGNEQMTRTTLDPRAEVPRDERPYWSAARDLDAAIEHLDLTAAHIIDRLQPFTSAASLPPAAPGDTPRDTSSAPAIARMEDAARAVRGIDSRLEALVHGLLQI